MKTNETMIGTQIISIFSSPFASVFKARNYNTVFANVNKCVPTNAEYCLLRTAINLLHTRIFIDELFCCRITPESHVNQHPYIYTGS